MSHIVDEERGTDGAVVRCVGADVVRDRGGASIDDRVRRRTIHGIVINQPRETRCIRQDAAIAAPNVIKDVVVDRRAIARPNTPFGESTLVR